MLGNSLVERLKALDIYKKVPSDLVQPTFGGALCKLYHNHHSIRSIIFKRYYNGSPIYQ